MLTQCKAYQRGNPKRRDYQLQKRYGITSADWDALFAKQGMVCAICVSPDPNGQHWHTDHCHQTGVVRGILCHHCNVLLGQAKDTILTLYNAIAYLRAHNG